MPHLILPAANLKRIIRQRRRAQADRKDEVWNGVYVMAPDADNLHELLRSEFQFAFRSALGPHGGRVVGGGNVTDSEGDWRKNYRCPDVLVFFPGNPAEDRGTHWFGGPDFAVEVLSPGDRARKKFDFYAKVGVRELLLVDRKPWRLELYRLVGGRLEPVGRAEPGARDALVSEVLPVTLRLTADDPRPQIEVTHQTDGRSWLV
jgi:Uma2 family endonuclease